MWPSKSSCKSSQTNFNLYLSFFTFCKSLKIKLVITAGYNISKVNFMLLCARQRCFAVTLSNIFRFTAYVPKIILFKSLLYNFISSISLIAKSPKTCWSTKLLKDINFCKLWFSCSWMPIILKDILSSCLIKWFWRSIRF